MRKVLGWSFGVLAALLVGVFVAQMIASETGEVVVLHTRDGAGEKTTRLWVVEHDGDLWLRSGGGASGWYERVETHPRVGLERHGRRLECTAEPTPASGTIINSLMAEKYGWRDDLIGVLVGGRDAAIPVRLRCEAPAPAAAD